MAPLKPHWKQPSHPDVQEVVINEAEFTSKSLSRVTLPPFGLYAKMDFPPCTYAEAPTYATVQCGRDRHLNLNSDLLYINHSCEPSLIFDTGNRAILAGPRGLQRGEELTFFYPSTEWAMAQAFDCACGTASCRGRIAGARDMDATQLAGVWLNGHIRGLLEEQQQQKGHVNGQGVGSGDDDATARALRDTLRHAEKVAEAAQAALTAYVQGGGSGGGLSRRGPTSRELSGEMGGDTVAA
ncbi:hypothetical protein F4780DRAFT_217017 [Xylariomycetidae sp. FL0641]|nr:hypothetical protein F4780DRAFT_217017 [Xylariomycetidae sp. FL0641]